MQKAQMLLLKALIAQTRVTESLLNLKDSTPLASKARSDTADAAVIQSMDAIAFVVRANHELNQRRRELIRPDLNEQIITFSGLFIPTLKKRAWEVSPPELPEEKKRGEEPITGALKETWHCTNQEAAITWVDKRSKPVHSKQLGAPVKRHPINADGNCLFRSLSLSIFIFNVLVMPTRLRIDKGTETADMATMHSYLLSKHESDEDSADCVIYGPSTENKIERWWKELLERLETFFKDQLRKLLEDGDYERDIPIHRNMLAYVYVPVVQKELDIFRKTVWNSHRGRKQQKKQLPCGVPDHIYYHPEQYGGERCGYIVSEEHLEEVAKLSGVLEDTDDFLNVQFRASCEEHIPNTDEIKPDQAANAYLFLKSPLHKHTTEKDVTNSAVPENIHILFSQSCNV
ncbi:uncharacterized protein LOC114544557 [Dendronephthya gigantea]|uniref:uncharacterized protein LOC114544557 n=1 Tax=Dendronephthya gigantea TaxID=151771 RepID=UPI00106BAA77|nr:uncharacterized protein LOC114544557 [Dendronephthya gigantea]